MGAQRGGCRGGGPQGDAVPLPSLPRQGGAARWSSRLKSSACFAGSRRTSYAATHAIGTTAEPASGLVALPLSGCHHRRLPPLGDGAHSAAEARRTSLKKMMCFFGLSDRVLQSRGRAFGFIATHSHQRCWGRLRMKLLTLCFRTPGPDLLEIMPPISHRLAPCDQALATDVTELNYALVPLHQPHTHSR